MAAYKAFREPGLLSDPLVETDFSDFEQRKLRYAVYWAFYQNTLYRDINSWSKAYKTNYALYRYIRGVYNPAHRLGEFWKSHLMGGSLDTKDSKAGKGGALPIETQNDTLRPALAELWKWSNWTINKDIFTLHGAIFGDVALQVVDDAERGKVYLQVVHPGLIKEIEKDPFGNIKAYTFSERRKSGKNIVEYVETAERDGDDVIYKTYKNGKLHAWDGDLSQWREPYGFIPLVMVQHNNVGLDWGWSEFHPDREKIHEADDLASKLHDQVRKIVDAPMLMSGVSKGAATPTTTRTQPATAQQQADNPQPGREEMNILYGPVGSTATPLVAPLDIAATSAEIKEMISEIERDYPELKVDILRASGDVSGRALRIAQQPAEDKVRQRRANYDDALVRAQQMALAIGGFREYDGFKGFGLDSYADGALDHSIGPRPVFAEDPMDKTEIDKAFWEAANGAIKAGVPLLVYLKRNGWDVSEIAELQADPEWQTKAEMQAMAVQMQRTVAGGGEGGGQGDDNQDGDPNADNQKDDNQNAQE
jgi:hypothetical protein